VCRKVALPQAKQEKVGWSVVVEEESVEGGEGREDVPEEEDNVVRYGEGVDV
jgi:hypothetical protein